VYGGPEKKKERTALMRGVGDRTKKLPEYLGKGGPYTCQKREKKKRGKGGRGR